MDNLKDKFAKLLEEKSLLEDEILSIASLARSYQSQAKSSKEEYEKLEASYSLMCSQNSNLEAEVIRISEELQVLTAENQLLSLQNEELSNEVQKLKETYGTDSKSNAIKELSYIILSKDHGSTDSPLHQAKYSEFIKEALESKIKSMEKERDDYQAKYKECLGKYIESLKQLKCSDDTLLHITDKKNILNDDMIMNRIQATQMELELSVCNLEAIECEEVSFCTSLAESPKISSDNPKKSRSNLVPVNFLAVQAGMIEKLLSSLGPNFIT